ncbi:uncharacterized protein B0H18DRAFT_984848 [Fomitopsis serialis]|uniref:uncharacterized protein n=1 Tax=Fomitopsis serialis TaxID=139415 RepID=UPI002007445E|nr:uncharacterized protein B0H18DRAFT_984848 [Neoantrodia serialis]KAH9932961.1 hypothetical protein B0H18DRAFT_984848 [Neoantrodia serialis]
MSSVRFMAPRGLDQVQSDGQGGNVVGGPASHPDSSSSGSSSSSSGGRGASNIVTRVVIPVCVTIVLVLFAALLVRWIVRALRGARSRQGFAATLPTVAEKPQLFEVQIETPPAVYPVNARWNDIKVRYSRCDAIQPITGLTKNVYQPLSVKYIPQDVYDVEQAVAANLSSYPGTPATSRPVSMLSSSSHSSGGSRGGRKAGEDGRLRVAVTIAMPSPKLPQYSDEKGKGGETEEEPLPLYLGVADLPWQATKLEA